MDQTIRNKLRGVVTQCRKLLEDSTAQALQGRFGIYAARKKGEVHIEDEARMAHLTEEDRACRQDLLDHLEHIKAIGYKPSEALEQLVREISFTHLNRLCAYKMMESRGLIREAVSRGLKSQGFFFYLADHPEDEKLHNGGAQETAYRNFLDWLGGTLSQEIGVLFNPNDPANRIYPPQRVLDEVLSLINDGDLKDIWSQDETIGWVYQYFTPKELRDKARKESQAPRNSYELAFRNQFFTPRYVVEFLTDNTLGRIWYEMRKGKTILKDRCKYLVRRPTEIFLKDGEQPPAESKEAREDLSQEELLKQPVYVPHRRKKDPREQKALDPACGSGHFLLYCFDLLQTIYEEAYDDPDLGATLRKDYPALEDLRRAVPGLILKHNLHGIDIDLRATQIAALALWLRCQRAYREMGLKNGERPKITRSNIVCAEPMPGETDLLKEFTATLQPKVLGQLVEAVFEKMKLAGEAGSLLKIEEEIRDAAGKANFEFIQWKKHQDKAKWSLFPELVKRDQPSIFDFADMTDEVFFDRAEDEIVAALRQYAEKAANGKAYRKRLFAEDAAQGFSFVDVCRKKYDVVLMNPPFGQPTTEVFKSIRKTFQGAHNDIYCSFVRWALSALTGGRVGIITSRSFLLAPRLVDFRVNDVLPHLELLLDFGLGVMDEAYVESAAYVLSGIGSVEFQTFDLRRNAPEHQQTVESGLNNHPRYCSRTEWFHRLPKSKILYSAPSSVRRMLDSEIFFEPNAGTAREGMKSFNNERFLRLWWEVSPSSIGRDRHWVRLAKGGGFAFYYSDIHLLLNWSNDGSELQAVNQSINGSTAQVRQASDYWYLPGATYSKRSAKGFSARALPADCIFTSNGPAVLPYGKWTPAFILGWLNSKPVRAIIHMQANFADYSTGAIKNIPWLGQVTKEKREELERATINIVERLRLTKSFIETSPYFQFISGGKDCIRDTPALIQDQVQSVMAQWDAEIARAYGFEALEWADEALNEKAESDSNNQDEEDSEEDQDAELASEYRPLIAYSIGCVLGRWDIRLATGERQRLKLPDPFDPLPVCPPGMLQGPSGLPAKLDDVPSDYPIRIDWDGILVDDPGHEDDIVRRVRDVLEVIWKDRAEALEREACEILGVRELRDYFRKPGNGGFWMDHVKRYSKSRRKAPIYWYLRSAKGNYGLWLYYHRLDKDILFKALLNYVEPKIRLEEDRLRTLRGRKEAAGSSGREAKQIEKDMDRQDQLVSELHDFADKLRRAANLHLVPDLNDGVVLTIAPLFELVPWKEAKECWEDLVEGKYEWSSIDKQMREKGLVKK